MSLVAARGPSAAAWLGLLVAVACAPAHEVAEGGVVVERAGAGGAAARAGLRPGDVLTSWTREAAPPVNPDSASGTLSSPFDVWEVQHEQAPRGAVAVTVRRAGQAMQVIVPPGRWTLDVRPRLESADVERLESLRREYVAESRLESAEEADAADRTLSQLAAAARARGALLDAAWLLQRAGIRLGKARQWEESSRRFEEAAQAAQAAADPVAESAVLQVWASALVAQRDFERAIATYERILPLWHGDGSLVAAMILDSLGYAAAEGGDLSLEEEYHRRALALRERLAPESYVVSQSLNGLARALATRSELAAAEELSRRAFALLEEAGVEGDDVVGALIQLGVILFFRGDLAAGHDAFRRGFEMRQRLDPEHQDMAGLLNNLGMVATLRGDLAAAERYYEQAVEIDRRLIPDSVLVAEPLSNLGTVALRRGNLERAAEIFARVLRIYEEVDPDSLPVASTRYLLGSVASERGDVEAAERSYRRALEIEERLAPDGLGVVRIRLALARVALESDDLGRAAELAGTGLELADRLQPGSGPVALGWKLLGDIQRRGGDLSAAERSYRRALEVQETIAPASARAAETWHGLGLVLRASGRRQEARRAFVRAIEAIEGQQGRLGGSDEVRTGFRARYIHLYRDLIDLLLAAEEPEEAFLVLERSRARELLAMLSQRDLVFALDLPPELDAERRRLAHQYDRVQDRLAALSPADHEGVEEAVGELRRIRNRQERVRARVRELAPRLAALQSPTPLDVGSVRRYLDSGTLLLTYSVGPERSHLFAVSATGPLRVATIEATEVELRQAVERLRFLIDGGRAGEVPVAALTERAQRLYALLLGPMEAEIAAAKRLLVVPDGPLHLLPFSVMVRPVAGGAAGGRVWQYLLEWKPLHVAASATVYAELRDGERKAAAKERPNLVAFGDPEVDAGAGVAARASVSGPSLPPPRRLPASRIEVDSISRLYGATALAYLGADATEARAKSIPAGTSVLHFATHGVLDERFPLDSGLVLATPARRRQGDDNGLLQAWEILEQLRLDASLVVLSACDTGLGTEVAGEGLLGLSRAFQFAGASSVLASLWTISDRSTAVLMERFYSELKAGRPKDEALRSAQLALLRGPVALPAGTAVYRRRWLPASLRRLFAGKETPVVLDASHPWHWAAFELIGDWR